MTRRKDLDDIKTRVTGCPGMSLAGCLAPGQAVSGVKAA